MPKGGYRKPNNPAPVSGPGALSRRTDGGPTQGAMPIPAGQYGERKQLQEMQTSAKMAGNSTPQRKVIGIFEPNTDSSMPITHGAPVGPGSNTIDTGRTVMPMDSENPYVAIRAAYQMFPSESLRRMIEIIDNEGL